MRQSFKGFQLPVQQLLIIFFSSIWILADTLQVELGPGVYYGNDAETQNRPNCGRPSPKVTVRLRYTTPIVPVCLDADEPIE